MHKIQEQLLELSKKEGFGFMSLRDMATAIGLPESSPQKIKHHLSQLERKGFFVIDKSKGTVTHSPKWTTGILSSPSSTVFSIPIIGVANCGPASVFAETNFQGFLKVSSNLLSRRKADGLYAVRADGSSMNRAEINGKILEDNDYAIVDSNQRSPSNKEIVLAIIDNKATIKRFIDDKKNGQIVLMADSSFDYEPIYLHADDEFNISGKVVDIIKRPKLL
jgi:SOS-response transcriptional repressor LexA